MIKGHMSPVAKMCSSSASQTSHHAAVDGVRIHYEKTSTGNYSLLFLPDALESSRTDFAPQLEKLNKDKYTVSAVDPGVMAAAFHHSVTGPWNVCSVMLKTRWP